MVQAVPLRPPSEPMYQGLRLSADEYLALENDGFRYELIHGVVVTSPRPTPLHQDCAGVLYAQLKAHVLHHPIGHVWCEVDVRLGPDLIYTPDIVFFATGRIDPRPERITVVPDLVVEVLSPSTRALDQKTKRDDYERSGVKEYWMVDPATAAIRVLRLKDGRYAECAHDGLHLASPAIPGFSLDLAAFKKCVLG